MGQAPRHGRASQSLHLADRRASSRSSAAGADYTVTGRDGKKE